MIHSYFNRGLEKVNNLDTSKKAQSKACLVRYPNGKSTFTAFVVGNHTLTTALRDMQKLSLKLRSLTIGSSEIAIDCAE